MHLADNTIFITGGTSGIGRGLALATSREEALVDSAIPLRNNAGPDEHKLVNDFNAHLAEHPIPVGT